MVPAGANSTGPSSSGQQAATSSVAGCSAVGAGAGANGVPTGMSDADVQVLSTSLAHAAGCSAAECTHTDCASLKTKLAKLQNHAATCRQPGCILCRICRAAAATAASNAISAAGGPGRGSAGLGSPLSAALGAGPGSGLGAGGLGVRGSSSSLASLGGCSAVARPEPALLPPPLHGLESSESLSQVRGSDPSEPPILYRPLRALPLPRTRQPTPSRCRRAGWRRASLCFSASGAGRCSRTSSAACSPAAPSRSARRCGASYTRWCGTSPPRPQLCPSLGYSLF